MIETILAYKKNKQEPLAVENIASSLKDKRCVIWIDIYAPSKEDVDFLGKTFGFHKVALDDCITDDHRSKIEDYDSYFFMAIHAFESEVNLQNTYELNVFVGQNFIVTVHRDKLMCIQRARDKIIQRESLKKGPDYALHVILDFIIDNYFKIIESVDFRLDVLETQLFSNPDQKILASMFTLKKDILHLRKTIYPQREIYNTLVRGDFKQIKPQTFPYIKDAYNEVIRLIDVLEVHRDMISTLLESYLSIVSNRLNEVMKILTVITTMIMPLTLITGIYGMNFQYMPELSWKYGYPFALLLILVLSLSMYSFVKRKKWL